MPGFASSERHGQPGGTTQADTTLAPYRLEPTTSPNLVLAGQGMRSLAFAGPGSESGVNTDGQ
jgi:hypothetical protein